MEMFILDGSIKDEQVENIRPGLSDLTKMLGDYLILDEKLFVRSIGHKVTDWWRKRPIFRSVNYCVSSRYWTRAGEESEERMVINVGGKYSLRNNKRLI